MRFANEMDTILLEEIMSSSHKFKQINTISECVCVCDCMLLTTSLLTVETVNGTGGQVFDDENSKLVSYF